MQDPNLYATDGLCHNSELAWYGQECGRPAAWIGYTAAGWVAGFCDRCKDGGRDTRNKVRWVRCDQVERLLGPNTPTTGSPPA